MRLLLLADGVVGSEIFSWLAESWPSDLGLVVTICGNEIAEHARTRGIPTTVFESEEQLITVIQESDISFDLGLCAWWPKILSKSIIDVPAHGIVNTHPSFLPYNRGKHYNFWAIVEEVPFGVTLHRVDVGIDNGAIISQSSIPYDWEDTGKTLYEKASAAMIELVKSTYPDLRSLQFQSSPQPAGAGSFHRAAELGAASQIFLDDTYTARSLLNRLRAKTFAPHPGCWFKDGDDVYEIQISIKKRAK